jgi:ADP-ribose pyrophosphatase YjhB (NUDIX family)
VRPGNSRDSFSKDAMATTNADMTVLNFARKVQAIAQNGLTFTQDIYDRERFQQLQELAASLVAAELAIPLGQAKSFWKGDDGYATPKVDVRGAIFDRDKVLLVRERSDGGWTMPGGWVDVNDAPSEAVVREVFEESGYRAKAVKLAALVDRMRHPHPPSVHHIYKLFFLCEITGGTPTTSDETDGVDFFPINALPQLSTGRTLASQVLRMHEHWLNRDLPTDFD